MNILGHKWHRRDVDGRAAASEAHNLRVIGKTDIELARGDHLSNHHLSAAIVEILARQALEKLSASFFAHDFQHVAYQEYCPSGKPIWPFHPASNKSS